MSRAARRCLLPFGNDVYAKGSVYVSGVQVKTWSTFHRAWYGDLVPVIPLTIDSIRRVSAAFKDGRYSTFPNYLTRAKDAHTEAGYPWSPLLERAATNARRSVLRTIGPSIGALALPLLLIASQPWIATPPSAAMDSW